MKPTSDADEESFLSLGSSRALPSDIATLPNPYGPPGSNIYLSPRPLRLCARQVLVLSRRRLVLLHKQPLLLLDHPLHDVVDVFAENVERLGIDVRVRDERAKVDCRVSSGSARIPELTEQPQQMLRSVDLRHWLVRIGSFLLDILRSLESV